MQLAVKQWWIKALLLASGAFCGMAAEVPPLAVPLSVLKYGDNTVMARVFLDGAELAARPLNLVRLEPRPGYETKADFVRGVLLKDQEPFFPVGICGHNLQFRLGSRGSLEDDGEMFKYLAEDVGLNLVVRNCLIASNRMAGISSTGAGIEISGYQAGGSGPNPLEVRVESCTIVGNAATLDYGGMSITNGVEVWNTLVVSNQADRYYPDLREDADFIALVRYSCSPVLTNAENGNIVSSPVFVDYAAGDYRLAAGSPGVHAGTNQVWMAGAVDLAGRLRRDRFTRQTDMGCYEYVPPGTLFQ